jgi:hypothetical protein
MSSDNFRACETRKGGVWLLKFDWLQLQTRGKTEVSKEGKLAGSGKCGSSITTTQIVSLSNEQKIREK